WDNRQFRRSFYRFRTKEDKKERGGTSRTCKRQVRWPGVSSRAFTNPSVSSRMHSYAEEIHTHVRFSRDKNGIAASEGRRLIYRYFFTIRSIRSIAFSS